MRARGRKITCIPNTNSPITNANGFENTLAASPPMSPAKLPISLCPNITQSPPFPIFPVRKAPNFARGSAKERT